MQKARSPLPTATGYIKLTALLNLALLCIFFIQYTVWI